LIEWFVTGTDTGVGKTTVARAILRAARARGLATAAMKPVESGCTTRTVAGAATLVPADAEALAAEATSGIPLDLLCPFRYAAPVAPGIAAERAGQPIEMARILACREEIVRTTTPDLLLIEGAGGLLVPLGAGRTVADLARALGAPLLIVARDALGTINHTLLTVEVARTRGLEIGGVVFCAGAGSATATREIEANARSIEEASGVPVLCAVPRFHRVDDEALRQMAASLDRDRILVPRGTSAGGGR
jgi:dethiobiotin synthetase